MNRRLLDSEITVAPQLWVICNSIYISCNVFMFWFHKRNYQFCKLPLEAIQSKTCRYHAASSNHPWIQWWASAMITAAISRISFSVGENPQRRKTKWTVAELKTGPNQRSNESCCVNTGLSWEFDQRQKFRWNIPIKVRPILNTYG